MNIEFFLLLLTLVINPLFSLNTIYMLYDIYKIGYKNLEEQKRKNIKKTIMISLIVYVILTMSFIFLSKIYEMYIVFFLLFLTFGIIYRMFFENFYNNDFHSFIYTKPRKFYNFIFNIIVVIVLAFFEISIFKNINKINSLDIKIPDNITSFSKENNMVLFEHNELTYFKSYSNDNWYYYCNNKDYFLSIEESDKYSIIILDKKANESFELSLDNLKISTNIFYDKFKVNTKYRYFNIQNVCFLISKDNFYEVKASIKKDVKNNDFYVDNFYLINMKTGEVKKLEKN